MRKKLLLAFSLLVGGFSVHAADGLLKSDFLSGYQVGDVIEKGTYTTGAAAMLNQWNKSARAADAFGANPLAVTPLVYADYINSGKDVAIGLLSQNAAEARVSTFTLAQNGTSYLQPSTFYLAFNVSVSSIPASGRADFFGFVEDHVGQNFRQQLYIVPSGGAGSGLYKVGITTDNGSSYVQDNDVIHSSGDVLLVVLKITFDGNDPMANGAVSVFVNPVRADEEPALPAVLSFTTASSTIKLKNIRGIAVRQCPGFAGSIGGFVLTDSWSKLWSTSGGTSIEDVESDREIESVSYYNLSGNAVSELSANSVYIQKTRYTNGDVETKKVLSDLQ